jgi:hypothetical protein
MIQQYHPLSIYQKECKSAYNRDTFTAMFIPAIFTIAVLESPRCPSTNEWIKKMWYKHTMEYDSAVKKNEIKSLTGQLTEIEVIMLSEKYRVRKTKMT